METKKCLICNKEFETNNNKKRYCSRYHDIQCPVCGKIFSCRSVVILRHRENNINTTCSRRCVKRPIGSLINKQPTKIVFKNCEICGKEFLANHHKNKRFCSPTHIVHCFICGETKVKASKGMPRHYVCKKCIRQLNFLEKDLQSNNEISLCGFNYRNLPTEEELTYYNNLTTKEKFEHTSLKHYGTRHPSQSQEVKEKGWNTTIEHYGGIGFASKEITEKYHKTCLDKYGTEWASQSEEVKDKIKQTNLERFGAENVYASEYGKQKIKETNLKKYGTEYSMSATKDTLPRNSNVDVLPIDKILNTKKKNKTFNTSKPEKELGAKLKELYSDLKTQYKSKEYPFACDFYIPSLDLYIEYNGSWTHGNHFFDENNQDDLDTLKLWRSKDTEYYNNAIMVWTIKDVQKLETAIKNNLNYIAWFNQEQAYDWIEKMRVG